MVLGHQFYRADVDFIFVVQEDKAKGSAKRQNKKAKNKAKAGSKTPNTRSGETNKRQGKSDGYTNGTNLEEDDDDDDAFLDRAARVSSGKKRNQLSQAMTCRV